MPITPAHLTAARDIIGRAIDTEGPSEYRSVLHHLLEQILQHPVGTLDAAYVDCLRWKIDAISIRSRLLQLLAAIETDSEPLFNEALAANVPFSPDYTTGYETDGEAWARFSPKALLALTAYADKQGFRGQWEYVALNRGLGEPFGVIFAPKGSSAQVITLPLTPEVAWWDKTTRAFYANGETPPLCKRSA